MKIKKIIFVILISLIFIGEGNSEINDSLFMTIGNRGITQSDIVNEIKILLILNNESYTEEKRDKLQKIAVNSIIKRNVKEIELERNNYFNLSKQDFNNELKRLANNANVDVDTLRNIFSSNELDFSIIEKQIETELYWNSLIFELYKHNISVNLEEIDEKLKLKQGENTQEYLISEILIKLPDENNVDSEIEKLKNKINVDGFENTAKSFSISKSALNGGNLGWVNENAISEKIKSIITETAVGKLSKPIFLTEGIFFFKIKEKRKTSDNLSLEERKNELIDAEKTKILNLHSLSHYDKTRRSLSVKFLE